MPEQKRATVRLSPSQYNLARRRLFVEDTSWQKVLNALVNAYIAGDITVTAQGRYHVAPPSSLVPQVQVPINGDLIEIEVDWGVASDRPQVGTTAHQQHPRNRSRWGTRELTAHLREVTGRGLRVQSVRVLLRSLDIPKSSANSKRWVFDGPTDKNLPRIITAIENGTYDSIVREGLSELEAKNRQRREQARELKDAEEQTAKQRRLAHLKRVRRASSTNDQTPH